MHDDHARSRRLLAVRVRHSEGRHRASAGGRPRCVPQPVVEMSPFLADRVGELKSWDDVKLLSVAVDRLRQWWRPGLICIGDAAHAMSPIGGVGINLAVQDAVAAANRLAAPLKAGTASDDDLRAIQARRTFPVRFTQRLQLTMQNRIIGRALASTRAAEAAAAVQAVRYVSASAAHPGASLLAVRAVHGPSTFRIYAGCLAVLNLVASWALPRRGLDIPLQLDCGFFSPSPRQEFLPGTADMTMTEENRPETARPLRTFQADVAKLLHLMVHSVYSEKSVFLRELICQCRRCLRAAALRGDRRAGAARRRPEAAHHAHARRRKAATLPSRTTASA